MELILFLFTPLCVVIAAVAMSITKKTKVPDARMLRYPDVSLDRIVFVYAGDLWTAPRQGGLARKLSSPKGHELFPKFSPDGQWIGFSGNYDGNTDVYIMPADGGTPERLTHYPEQNVIVCWYPDGQQILYRSRMFSPSRRFNRFFKQTIAGGLPEVLPMPYGEFGSFNPDGTRMVFQFISREFHTWKRYRGGMASDLWLYDFTTNTSEKLTDFDGTDAVPMWHGNTIYFLSDRDHLKKLNIWAYDLDTRQIRQITKFTEFDVKWPGLGPDAIIFENGGNLYILDLKTEIAESISVRVPADLPDIRMQLKNVSGRIRNFSLSPTGKRALFEARGDIFTVPQKHGSIRNLTKTCGIAERYPAWSPDGKYVAYFSDRTGEYELHLRPGDGNGEEKQVTEGGGVFRYWPVWSPDSKRIAFSDKTGSLYLVELEDGKSQFIDKDEWGLITSYSWSEDSRWLAYSKRVENSQGAIMIYDTKEKHIHQVTGGYYYDDSPVFDWEGKYLFFYSIRTFKPLYGDIDDTWIYANATNIFAVTLRKDLVSPTAPRSDEEEGEKEETAKDNNDKDKDKNDESDQEKEKNKKKKEPEPVQIDFDRIETRIVKMPIEAGNYGLLRAVKGKLVYIRYPATGTADSGDASGTLIYYDLKEREEKTALYGIDAYDISANGKNVIYRSKNMYGIINLEKDKKVGDGKISIEKMKAWIDPLQEWRQIFNEAWRIERDFFYDPGMHGVDWQAVKKRYESLLPYVVDRDDLNYVIGEMIAELNASHTYVWGGDMESPRTISVGLLGCDFELDRDNQIYRIKTIYEGAVWDATVRSPLRQPGMNVEEGDYLLAVNGQPLDPARDPWASLQGLAGEVVTLTINSKPTKDDSREIIVEPLKSENALRNLAWIEANRRNVAETTEDRVGYIYVPDTGRNGQNELVRQFIPQRNKEALIIDCRFNSGGQIPDRFIELLNRPIYNFWARRDHRDWQTPFYAHNGPKVMIINGWAASGGDAFPYYFRKANLGPLVGKRTWGGLIGISGNPQPIDAGYISAPTLGFFNTMGQWEVEGYGVEPDYEVENTPHELAAGRDLQLEKAIEVVLELLNKAPATKLKKPVYPDRSNGTMGKI